MTILAPLSSFYGRHDFWWAMAADKPLIVHWHPAQNRFVRRHTEAVASGVDIWFEPIGGSR